MKTPLLFALAATLLLASGLQPTFAEDVYGHQLMTQEELTEHRNKMRSFKTKEEREQYRMEHHEMMKERAKEQGVDLPDEPMPQGMGRGGMGPGGGGRY